MLREAWKRTRRSICVAGPLLSIKDLIGLVVQCLVDLLICWFVDLLMRCSCSSSSSSSSCCCCCCCCCCLFMFYVCCVLRIWQGSLVANGWRGSHTANLNARAERDREPGIEPFREFLEPEKLHHEERASGRVKLQDDPYFVWGRPWLV